MSNNTGPKIINSGTRPSLVGLAGVGVLVALSGLAVLAGLWKVLVISWVAFAAMAGSIPLGVRAAETGGARRLVWGYGLASGAMITSAAVFLVPQAMSFDPRIGGFGIAAGILVGFGSHVLGHRLSHLNATFDDTAVQLSAHALSAGAIIGLVYAAMPELGLLLGLSIVSHKGPAGYAAARRLAADGRSASVILLPAAGVGVTGIPTALLSLPAIPALNAAVFGFAAGVFLHVAMDFLPRCEIGGEVGEVAQVSDHAHELLDRLRIHAVLSTSLGGLAVFLAWIAIGP
ncbi:ZIP family metal transporter [Halorientalis sp. IM1011]|uniref:ZIP family metal transporter n=1 Tax=Halorientalis sp. IM1011 TaxID=1932360 RepID=UPI00097CC94B|nr:ZIP family metal transporter [Halorientalis sp. IM1011]AQL43595.1 ZIP family metal transporter [Halorientalis sp. IM1011]